MLPSAPHLRRGDYIRACIITGHLRILPNASACCCCSVTQSFLTLCDPMHCSISGFPVLHYLLEFTQTKSIESMMPCNHLNLCASFSSSSHLETVTGRKARGLQTEQIACKCQTFLSLLSGRRKQTSNIFSFSIQI